jgi:hypothetical protein
MNSSKFPNSDRLFGMAAFLVSMGTFLIYIYEARLLQKQQYASALPYLEMWNSTPAEGIYKLQLVNNGVGPAFVKDVKVHYQGRIFEGDHLSFYYKAIPRNEWIRFLSTNLPKGRVLPAGHVIDLILHEGPTANAKRLNDLFGGEKVKIEITYSSVYDETWRVTGMAGAPEKLDD